MTRIERLRAELAEIAGKPGKEQAAVQRLLATLDGRVEESDRIRAASGLAPAGPCIVHTATSSSFHPMTAEQARKHCKARGLL